MTKTPITYKETLQGILEMYEIESIVMDNLIKVQKYLFRNYRRLSINQETIKHLHTLLSGNLFQEAGTYRKYNIELGSYIPPEFFNIPHLMKDWEDDYKERKKHVRTKKQKVELCA